MCCAALVRAKVNTSGLRLITTHASVAAEALHV